MEFKDRIRQLRLERELSYAQIAAMLEKSESAIRMWESGKSKPDADTLIKLSQYFKCSTDYLLGLCEFKNEGERKRFNRLQEDLISKIEALPNNVKEDFYINLIQFSRFNSVMYDTGLSEHFCKLFISLTNKFATIEFMIHYYQQHISNSISLKDSQLELDEELRQSSILIDDITDVQLKASLEFTAFCSSINSFLKECYKEAAGVEFKEKDDKVDMHGFSKGISSANISPPVTFSGDGE